MTAKEYQKVIRELEEAGYTPYLNPHDAATASELPCEECGETNVVGYGLRLDNKRGTYHAWAVCPDCGHAYEF